MDVAGADDAIHGLAGREADGTADTFHENWAQAFATWASESGPVRPHDLDNFIKTAARTFGEKVHVLATAGRLLRRGSRDVQATPKVPPQSTPKNGHPWIDKPCCCYPACRRRFFFSEHIAV